MAVAMVIKVPGVTAEQYDEAMMQLGLTGDNPDWPDGVISHLAGSAGDDWVVVDVWESRAQFDTFLETRLGAVIHATGMPMPEVTQVDIHNRHGV